MKERTVALQIGRQIVLVLVLVQIGLQTVQIVLVLVTDPGYPDMAALGKTAPDNGRASARRDPENGQKAAPASGFEIVREVGQPAERSGGTVLAVETLAGTPGQGHPPATVGQAHPLGSGHAAVGQVILVFAALW